jgi:hypothetical protein
MRILVAAAVILQAAFAANVPQPPPQREVATDCPLIAGTPVPEFRGGRVFRFDDTLMACAPDGTFAFHAPIQLPGAASVIVNDVGVDPDGTFVVAAAGRQDGRPSSHGLVMLDGHGIQTGFIDTKEFVPSHVAVADDHSIWVLGFRNRKPAPSGEDYMILRRYSREGVAVGGYLPRSTFPAGLEPGAPGSPTALMVAHDSIAVVAVAGNTSAHREIVMLDYARGELGRMPLLDEPRAKVVSFALTSDGQLYGWRQSRAEGLSVLRFDVAAKTWKGVDPPGACYTLIGADGESLVYRDHSPQDGKVHLAWFAK